MNLPYEDRLCTKCSSADIGDEFHYVFSCPFLLNPEEKTIFHHFIVKMQMLIDFSLLLLLLSFFFFFSKKTTNDYW